MFVEINGINVLIDVGISMKKMNMGLLSTVGIDLEDIDTILITHSHTDHTHSLKPISKRYNAKIIMPKQVYDDIVETRKYVLPKEKLSIINDRKVTSGKMLDIEPVRVNHDVPAYAYILTDKSTKETYLHLADNGGIKRKDMVEKFTGMTYYAIESNYDHHREVFHETRPLLTKRRTIGYYGHTENSDAISFATRVVAHSTKGIIFHHLSRECNSPELAQETHMRMLEIFGNVRKMGHVRMLYALQDDTVELT